MPAITLEELINAQRDAEDLESVVNGSATLNGTGELTTRLGTTLSTLAKLQASFPPGSTALAAYGSASAPGMSFNGDTNCGMYRITTDKIGFATAGAARMAILADGKIGIGTIQPVKTVQVYNGGSTANFVVATDDRNDGFFVTPAIGMQATSSATAMGSMSPHNLELYVNGGARAVLEIGGALRPSADNGYSSGTASYRWSVVYAGTGTINTSDEREKIWRGGLSEAELRAAQRLLSEIGIFQWTEAITAKGVDGARLHVGVRAQRVWAIMAEEGLVAPIGENGRPSGPCPYAFLCYDEWEGDERSELRGGSRYGVRYDQLQMFMMAALAANILGGSGD